MFETKLHETTSTRIKITSISAKQQSATICLQRSAKRWHITSYATGRDETTHDTPGHLHVYRWTEICGEFLVILLEHLGTRSTYREFLAAICLMVIGLRSSTENIKSGHANIRISEPMVRRATHVLESHM